MEHTSYRFLPEDGSILRDALVVRVRQNDGQKERRLVAVRPDVILVHWKSTTKRVTLL
jgi:hypothetical protein